MNSPASGDAAAGDSAPGGAAPAGPVPPTSTLPVGTVDDLPAPEPMPYDGVASVAVGTVLWATAALVMLFFLDDLREDGHLWWLATAICGFVLGLAGLWIVVRRRNRLR
ncbi:DUF2530 domain-containing protein [Frankia sp. AgKG'84/4]|uniref:DUF2530 domain-containing protein n=1 Tax=Frankia sp. AgKG'84/4 TaxID=573490 RepID=UPI00200F28C2|nr:DUF2530 domain-containing protein [Frankia sp. AgKG'84/4]MCL9794236.1 DUF2530 domain-containing protein [Frankia sp. AgKG'84/4]